MKKFFSVFAILLLALCLPLSACNKTTSIYPDDNLNNETTSIVVYFSKSGNTGKIAKQISDELGSDLYRIVPSEEYPESYQETQTRAREEAATDARPEIENALTNFSKYNIVFIGFPIWNSNIPNIIKTFVESASLSNKVIVPFCTHGGSGFGQSLLALRSLLPDNQFYAGLEIMDSTIGTEETDEKISNWIESLSL